MSESDSFDRLLGYVVICIALYLVLRMMWCKTTEKYTDTTPVSGQNENNNIDEVTEPSIEKELAKTRVEMVTQPSQKLSTQLMNPISQCDFPSCDQSPHPNFLNEFANFRSMTNQSSGGMYPDMVDMVTEMYLSDNTEVARRYHGKQIKDVFAELTNGIGRQDLKCVRMPTMEAPLFPSGEPGQVHPYDEEQSYHTIL